MSEEKEEVASNESNSAERRRSRSPRRPAAQRQQQVAAVGIDRRTCPVCFRIFDSVKAMWGHSWVHRERGQVYNLPPPPPPPSVVGGGVGVAVAGSSRGGPAWHPWKIDSIDPGQRTCPTCSKIFGSPKAMYGHLHVHHEKAMRRRSRSAEATSTRFIRPIMPRRDPVVVQEHPMPVAEEEDRSPSLSIDLNRSIYDDDEEDTRSIDLNRSPPSC